MYSLIKCQMIWHIMSVHGYSLMVRALLLTDFSIWKLQYIYSVMYCMHVANRTHHLICACRACGVDYMLDD